MIRFNLAALRFLTVLIRRWSIIYLLLTRFGNVASWWPSVSRFRVNHLATWHRAGFRFRFGISLFRFDIGARLVAKYLPRFRSDSIWQRRGNKCLRSNSSWLEIKDASGNECTNGAMTVRQCKLVRFGNAGALENGHFSLGKLILITVCPWNWTRGSESDLLQPGNAAWLAL